MPLFVPEDAFETASTIVSMDLADALDQASPRATYKAPEAAQAAILPRSNPRESLYSLPAYPSPTLGYARTSLAPSTYSYTPPASADPKFSKKYQWLNTPIGTFQQGVGWNSHARLGEEGVNISGREKSKRMKALREAFVIPESEHLPFGICGEVIDERGRVRFDVLPHRKRRKATRWILGLLGLLVICGGLVSTIVIHPKDDPPPRGSIPAVALYTYSVFYFLAFFYVYAIRTCLARHRELEQPSSIPFAVSHVYNTLESESSGCCFGRRKPKTYSMNAGMTNNYFIQPNALGFYAPAMPHLTEEDRYRKQRTRRKHRTRKRRSERYRRRSTETTSSSSDSDFTDEEKQLAMDLPLPSPQARSCPLSILQQRRAYDLACNSLRRRAIFDSVTSLAWLGLVLWIVGFNKQCKPGSFGGWCDAYNFAIASAVFVTVGGFTEAWWTIQDIKMLKVLRSRV